MSLRIDGEEIQERYLEYGIRNGANGCVVYPYDDEEGAQLDALLYPNSEIVVRQVFETGWAKA